MIRLYHKHFEQPLDHDMFLQKLSQLPVSFHDKIRRYKRWQDQHASLFGKLLLLKGLEEFGYPGFDLSQIIYNEYGRPSLPVRIDFNISHSGNYVVCALSDEGNIGVDIEEIRPIDFQEFTSFFTPAELAAIQANENPLLNFYELWTKKEAVIKAEGKGLSIPLQEIKIEGDAATSPYDTWRLYKTELSPLYAGHLAGKNCEERIGVPDIRESYP